MTKEGIIRRWDMAKGFGFIRSSGLSADVFFHIKAFRSNAGALPYEGMTVRFEEVHVGGKGPRATVVQPLADKQPEHSAYLKRDSEASRLQRSHQRPDSTAARKKPERDLPAGAPAARRQAFFLMLAVWAGLLVFGLSSRRLSSWTLPALALLNIVTAFVYAFDKNAAGRGSWRTAESTLHLFAFAGGWPAAWLAQQVLRHKTSKQSFHSAYWATVVLHCTLLGGWLFWLYKRLPLP